MITVTVFHVSSDLAMLLIPVPMIARTRLPLMRKIILCIIFSLGLLVVLVAILNRYYNFTVENSLVFLVWYNGEASTAVMVANIPFCWTLLRRLFSLDAWSNSTRRSRNASGAQRLDDNSPGSGRFRQSAQKMQLQPQKPPLQGGPNPQNRQKSMQDSLSLIGIDPATESMECMTARKTGDTSLYHLDLKAGRGNGSGSSKGHTKTSSDGADTDLELGL